MQLKAFRTRYGITQHDLAKQLATTQQAIARWESGQSPIPAKHLRDIAVLLCCSIESLLGEDDVKAKSMATQKKINKTSADDELAYGTVKVDFGGNAKNRREWPITCGERGRLLNQMQDRNGEDIPSEAHTWINFDTLDDRMVFINASALESLRLISDDVEAMPSYEHAEVYRAIKQLIYEKDPSEQELDGDSYPYTKSFLDKCLTLIEEWGGDNGAIEHMECVLVESLDGEKSFALIEEEGAQDLLSSLLGYQTKDPSNQFAILESEGYHKATFYRYGALRLIELSKMKWQELFVDDEEE